MLQLPTLIADPLMLRPFDLSDAPEVQRLAGDRDIAATTERIPHPYLDGDAETWIQTHSGAFETNSSLELAIERIEGNQLIGAIGLIGASEEKTAELCYWIAKPWWGRGYATEAAACLVRYGLEEQRLNHIYAAVFKRNLASQRVLAKVGMCPQPARRREVVKWGVTEELFEFGITSSSDTNSST